MKVVGPLHKSDVGAVSLSIPNEAKVASEYHRLMQVKDAQGILIQPMLSGRELFIGAIREEKFGHTIMCGLGGIFIEVVKDVQAAISPVDNKEALNMIHKLRSYKIFQGVRGQKGINENRYAEIITRVSALLEAAPEINEMDLNPLMGNDKDVIAVDARISIEKH
jgi:acetyltransferase